MGGRRLGLLVILAVCGCGGGAASGGSPETGGASKVTGAAGDGETGTPSPRTAEQPASGAGKSPQAGGEPTPGESAVTTLEGEDLQSVLQSVLGDPELLDHLHLSKSGRSPLKVSGPNLPPKLKVVAGSYDVKVVDEPTAKNAAVLVFTSIERAGEQVRLHYRFDVEGLKGSATVSFKQGHWELTSNRVIEK